MYSLIIYQVIAIPTLDLNEDSSHFMMECVLDAFVFAFSFVFGALSCILLYVSLGVHFKVKHKCFTYNLPRMKCATSVKLH